MSDRRFVTYSKEFKEMAAKLYLEGGKSYKTLIEELGIKDTKTLTHGSANINAASLLMRGEAKRRVHNEAAPRQRLLLLRKSLRMKRSAIT